MVWGDAVGATQSPGFLFRDESPVRKISRGVALSLTSLLDAPPLPLVLRLLLEIIAFERDPLPGRDLDLAIPHQREAVREANVAGLGIAHTLADVESDRKEDRDPDQKKNNGFYVAVVSTHRLHSICQMFNIIIVEKGFEIFANLIYDIDEFITRRTFLINSQPGDL